MTTSGALSAAAVRMLAVSLKFGLKLGLALGLALGAPGGALGRPLLLPNLYELPGELGLPLAGAQTALVSGSEALWYNPAGLARESGRRLTASAPLLRQRTLAGPWQTQDAYEAGAASMAYADALGQGRGTPRFTLGAGLAVLMDQRWPTRHEQARQGMADALPPGFAPGVDVDATFPGGLRADETGEALGALRVLAPALGLGAAVSEHLRLGAVLQLERVSLALHDLRTTTYAQADANSTPTLSGHSQLAWSVAGESLRLRTGFGAQLQLTRGLTLGLTLELPTDTLQGSGRLLYQRADRFEIAGSSRVQSLHIARDGLEFRLDSPRRLRVGLAFSSDRVVVELDLYRLSAQPSYGVLPGGESQPPSTAAFSLPALETSGQAVTGFALGLAFAKNDRTSLLLGLALDPTPVPAEDPVFRSINIVTVTAGSYHVWGDLSVSLGVLWREGREASVSFPAADGGQALTTELALRERAVQVGGSVVF